MSLINRTKLSNLPPSTVTHSFHTSFTCHDYESEGYQNLHNIIVTLESSHAVEGTRNTNDMRVGIHQSMSM